MLSSRPRPPMNWAISRTASPRGISIPSWLRLRQPRSWKSTKLFRSARSNPSMSSRPRFSCIASCKQKESAMPDKPRLTREQIAQRAALELPDGSYVNLGWGIPNLIADYLPKSIEVYFHSENGILGMGRRARPGEEDFDLVDAMKVPVTLIPGASFFHQADAHLMTRGGHLDVAVLGGFQVSERGDLANWKIPGSKGSGGIGGAMDIAAGAKKLIVCMEHTTKEGAPKIVRQCTYPLTGLACVDTIVTDLAVIDVKPEGLVLREIAPGWDIEELRKLTGAPLTSPNRAPEIKFV